MFIDDVYSWEKKNPRPRQTKKQEEIIIQKGFIFKYCVLYSLQMNIEMSVENKKRDCNFLFGLFFFNMDYGLNFNYIKI